MTFNRSSGTFLYPDTSGLLHRPTLSPNYGAVLNALESVEHRLGERNDSAQVFVRGSAARGQLTPDVSDVDIVILLQERLGDMPRTITQNLPDSRIGPVEAEFYSLEEICTERFAYVPQMIALEGVHVAGPTFHTPWSEVPFGINLIFNLQVVGSRLRSASSAPDRPRVAAWIGKSLIRAAFECVMFEYRAYTRDLAACCRAWDDVYSSSTVELWSLAESVINGSCSLDEVFAVYEDLEPYIDRMLREYAICGRDDLRTAAQKGG